MHWEFHQALRFTFQKAVGWARGVCSVSSTRETVSLKTVCLEFNRAKIFCNSGYFSEFPWKLIFCLCRRQRFLLRDPAVDSDTPKNSVGLTAVSVSATSNTRG